MNTPSESGVRRIVWRLLIAAVGIVLAVGLIWLAFSIHMERACMLLDTPYLPLCDPAVESIDQRQAKLRNRLTAAPGDSTAWTQLTNIERGGSERALLQAVSLLAPNDPNVLRWRADDALKRADFSVASNLLVNMVIHRGSGEAAQALARIVASGEGMSLLRPHLATASHWLPPVLGQMPALKLPLASALPLLAVASAQKLVPQSVVNAYIQALKTHGSWGDAYALWLAQQNGPVPLLHNGGFNHLFQSDGFDWEVTPVLPSKAGAMVTQRNLARRGPVVEIELTGRPLAIPLLRQYLFLPPGKYVLRGKYMASRLRSEQGLAWSARCINTQSARALAGRSAGLTDSGGNWQTFQFELMVPPDCGQVTSLQLETAASFESAVGLKGRVSFDAFELRSQRL